MVALTEVLDHLQHTPHCRVLRAIGQPSVSPEHVVPDDVRAFYELCGGVEIGGGSANEVRIVGPAECVAANAVILADNTLGDLAEEVRSQLRGDASHDWYIIAAVENGNYLVIDFGRRHPGRCYDAFWETYAMPGQMPVVATSLTALIERLYEHRGQHWYWLQPEFEPLGDAYDAT